MYFNIKGAFVTIRRKASPSNGRSYRLVLTDDLSIIYDRVKSSAKANGLVYDPRPELLKAFEQSLVDAQKKLDEVGIADP